MLASRQNPDSVWVALPLGRTFSEESLGVAMQVCQLPVRD